MNVRIHLTNFMKSRENLNSRDSMTVSSCSSFSLRSSVPLRFTVSTFVADDVHRKGSLFYNCVFVGITFSTLALHFRLHMQITQSRVRYAVHCESTLHMIPFRALKRNGGETLGRCVMRSRTGSSALHCSKVQNMAASESRWLVEKSDCYAKTVRRFREILLKMK